MLRYLLFTGSQFYPGGGWSDFRGEFSTPEEAKKQADKEDDDWYEIVDTITKEKIYEAE